MSKLIYIGKVEGGKLIMSDHVRREMLSDLQACEGKRVEIVISKLPKRSNAQNAYYYAVIINMITERLKFLGHQMNHKDTHNFLKEKFNGKPICNQDGEIIGTFGESTTKMNKVDFMGYVAAIQIWAAQHLDLVIPDPLSQIEMFEKEMNKIV